MKKGKPRRTIREGHELKRGKETGGKWNRWREQGRTIRGTENPGTNMLAISK